MGTLSKRLALAALVSSMALCAACESDDDDTLDGGAGGGGGADPASGGPGGPGGPLGAGDQTCTLIRSTSYFCTDGLGSWTESTPSCYDDVARCDAPSSSLLTTELCTSTTTYVAAFYDGTCEAYFAEGQTTDPDAGPVPPPPPPPPPPEADDDACTNGFDDDADGLADCADPDCAITAPCSPVPPPPSHP